MTAPPVRQWAIHYAHFEEPIKSRPVLILSRTELNAVRENVIVALITRTIRQVPTEIPVGKAEGLPREGVASIADIHTVPKTLLSPAKGRLPSDKILQTERALKLVFALSQ